MRLFNLLGFGSKTDQIKKYIAKKAIIVDVRTIDEFKEGSISDSKNIPLGSIFSKINEIKSWNKPIIVCCKSGMRSSQAHSILKQNGIDTINGGGWQSLKNKL